MPKKKSTKKKKTIASHTHDDAKRKNIPAAEMQSVIRDEVKKPVAVTYRREGAEGMEEEKDTRDRDLDPQLVWRGKDQQDWSDLVVQAPPLFIQEKVRPKTLVDDLLRQTRKRAGVEDDGYHEPDLFADFNGLPAEAKSTDFYRHEGHWSNRMILGDGLQVMASLAEREGLRGKVQCIYLDPPYGIKFNSNFQWSTTSRDVKDGNTAHISREPEQVKAFRDTWRDGIHSYLTYLRDRLTVARDLLTESGSIFVQIGDENVHRVRALMDEVFGEENFVSEIVVEKTSGASMKYLDRVADLILWYGKDSSSTKYRPAFKSKKLEDFLYEYKYIQDDAGHRDLSARYTSGCDETKVYAVKPLTSQTNASTTRYEFDFRNENFKSGKRQWATPIHGLERTVKANRVERRASSIGFVRFFHDFRVVPQSNIWSDTGTGSFTDPKVYVVQSGAKMVQRCLLMTTDPGDLVLDPTCGSGTTAYVAEQWGRRWITIDTSRVALALARARIMGARYPFYLMADSKEGQVKEAEITRTAPSTKPVYGKLNHGFVYERVPHITLKSIANNAEIDEIWNEFQEKLEPLRADLNAAMDESWEEWEIPRQAETPWPDKVADLFHAITKAKNEAGRAEKIAAINKELNRDYTENTLPERPADPWPAEAEKIHAAWWKNRIAQQKEIDASIAAKADSETLYDKPYEDKSKVRVAGPFTVESVSPHRVLHSDENEEVVDGWKVAEPPRDDGGTDRHQDFTSVILENLKTAGVQQAHKEDKIEFSSINPWPGEYVCAEARYESEDGGGKSDIRAGVFIGPEFGTVSRPDLVAAAREAGDAGFDVLVACAFNYDAHSAEFEKLGALPILKARMNADLHMADDLKNTGKGNLFIIFGEPDIDITEVEGEGSGGEKLFQVKIKGVDVFKPATGEVVSGGPDSIACWFIDTDYNEESFFVRHAYFLGQNDPYKSLKTTLKAEIDHEAWSTLNSDVSRPFAKPTSGRIAVKVINHLGDEVMKVYSV